MSSYTENLNLFKYNTTDDANQPFNITTALNENWDKIDEFSQNVGGTWGSITGTLSDQTDLQTALNAKQDSLTSSQLLRVNATAYLKETYVNGTSGYNIWSNGYCEQWGQATFSNGGTTVTFLKTFANTYYNLTLALTGSTTGNGYFWASTNKKISQVYIYRISSNSVNITPTVDWKACGYLADGQY